MNKEQKKEKLICIIQPCDFRNNETNRLNKVYRVSVFPDRPFNFWECDNDRDFRSLDKAVRYASQFSKTITIEGKLKTRGIYV